MHEKVAVEIERVIKNDIGCRGLGDAVIVDDLIKAAEELYGSSKILIVTGFCILEPLCGETDGPLGAVSLAGALEQLGKTVMLLTDSYSEKIVRACKRAKGIKAEVAVVPFHGANGFCRLLLDSFKPNHIVAVERPGKAKNGRFYSMRGNDLTNVVPDTDILFELAGELGIKTTAVGDGGNELGMGKVKDIVVRSLKNGATIVAEASADYAIVAGVSNWGAHGLEAMLSVLEGRLLLHDSSIEKSIIKAMINAGAVDGCTGKGEPTVDGLSLEVNIDILKKLRKLVTENLFQEAAAD
ncbi:MAG: DUF4392 domain-containing protein [Caulobacteraceae bacterium]